MSGRCECCREGGARDWLTQIADLEFMRVDIFGVNSPAKTAMRVALCDGCAAAGHAPNFCKRCPEDRHAVWTCARIAHVSEFHPGLIERRVNAPDDPVSAPTSKKLGTLYFPEGE